MSQLIRKWDLWGIIYIFCRFEEVSPKSFPFQHSYPSMFYSSVIWRWCVFLHLTWCMVIQKAFHEICCTAVVHVPVLKIPSCGHSPGTSWLEHTRSDCLDLRGGALCCAVLCSLLTCYLFALCLERVFLSSGGKISLVCGSGGTAAQMGLLVRITGVSAALAGKEWEGSMVSQAIDLLHNDCESCLIWRTSLFTPHFQGKNKLNFVQALLCQQIAFNLPSSLITCDLLNFC